MVEDNDGTAALDMHFTTNKKEHSLFGPMTGRNKALDVEIVKAQSLGILHSLPEGSSQMPDSIRGS